MKNIRLYHASGGYDLLPASPEVLAAVGEDSTMLPVVRSDGEVEERCRVTLDAPHTDLQIPDDFVASPAALTNLVEMVTERHAPEEHVTGVSGDDPQLVAKLAALLNAEIVEA